MNDIEVLLFSFGRALVLTLIIELIVAFFFGVRKKKEIVVVICVNTLTNPLAMLYYLIVKGLIGNVSGILFQIPVEIVVVIVEAFIYRSYDKTSGICFQHPVLLALMANFTSWGIGVIIQKGEIL